MKKWTVCGMLRIAFCVGIILASAGGLRAQVDYSNDSLRVVNAEWSTDTMDGFYLRRYHFGEGALFCSAQNFCLIEIPPSSRRRLAFAASGQNGDTTKEQLPLTTLAEMAEMHGAYAAVNGSYFDMQYANPVCYLRINGRELGENTPSAKDSVNRKYYQYATMALRGGRPVLMVPDSNRLYESKLPDSNMMTAGPMLLWRGKPVAQRSDRSFVTKRHNRTALGVRADGTVLLLVVDGRFPHRAEGLSLPELIMVMRWLGCKDAINLDGGGSTTMYVRGDGDKVVNHPSDNHRYDHHGSRPIANALLVL